MIVEKKFGVAVKALIINPQNQFLIIKKSNLEDINPNTWDIPGGRINHGENLYSALWREIKEEIGIDVDIIRPSNVWSLIKRDLHLVGITFLCEAYEQEIHLSSEHEKYKWLSAETIRSKDFPAWLKDEIRKFQENSKNE